ncbi:hypothetical protein ACIQ1H_08015 [Lysinibacillus sp. NPDC097279]|uniref:hypothetical protein n=1 Tax=Lysinibacillus sp. NPDC097279 TaxID=3364143 RepID=UPI00381818AD
MKKFVMVVTLVNCLIIFSLIGCFGYIKYKLYAIKKETYEFLIDDKKYNKEQIYSIDSKLGVGILFQASVVFEDEQNIVYDYAKIQGQIKQIYPSEADTDDNYKHKAQ